MWESEYSDFNERDEDNNENHPIFGKEILINDNDVEVSYDDLISIIDVNGTSHDALKVY